MKKKWIILRMATGGLFLTIGLFVLWLAFATAFKFTVFAKETISDFSTFNNTSCVKAGRDLVSFEAWMSKPPTENIRILKEACFQDGKNEKASTKV